MNGRELQRAGCPPGKELVRKKEAAAILACSSRMIDRLVNAGKLRRVKYLGAVRYRLSEIMAIIEGKAS
jgi:predicted DNA-binding transcriptional regulator AlpA